MYTKNIYHRQTSNIVGLDHCLSLRFPSTLQTCLLVCLLRRDLWVSLAPVVVNYNKSWFLFNLIQFGMRSDSVYNQNWHTVVVFSVTVQRSIVTFYWSFLPYYASFFHNMCMWCRMPEGIKPCAAWVSFGVCYHCDEIKSLFLREWWLNICYASFPAGASGKLSLLAADIRLYWEGIPSSLTVGIPSSIQFWG